MPVWNLPAFHAAARQPWFHVPPFPQGTADEDALSSPGSSLQISHSSASKCEPPFPFTCGKLSARMAGGDAAAFPAPSLCLGAKGAYGSQGNHRAPRPDQAREAGIPTGREEGAGRDSPVCFCCWLSVCLWGCPMGSTNRCWGSAAWARVCEPGLSAASYSCWISK